MANVSHLTIIQMFTELIPKFFTKLCTLDLFLVFVSVCIVYWCAAAVCDLMGV